MPEPPSTSSSKDQQEGALRDYALSYLARFPVSKSRMRIVLLRRAQAKEQNLSEQGLAELLAELEELGYLNDEKFALGRVRGLLRRGASFYEIRGKLARDGVHSAQIQETLAHIEPAGGKQELELLQALKVARKRRLGPFRGPFRGPSRSAFDNNEHSEKEQRAKRDKKDLLALARKGFSMSTLQRLFTASEDELLQWQEQAKEED